MAVRDISSFVCWFVAVSALIYTAQISAQDKAVEKDGNPNQLYFPPTSGNWESVSASDSGWDEAKLNEALDYARKQNSSGVIVLLNGKILAENYWNVGRKSFRYESMLHGTDKKDIALEDVASVQKSISAVLVGVALDRHIVALDDPVAKYLGEGWSRAEKSQENKIKIRHLITMTTGLNDRLEFVSQPGKRWRYNTNAYSRIVNALEAAAEMDRNELTPQWLTIPIGMSDSKWVVRPFARKDPKTNRHGFATSVRDLARFGLLLLANGNWGDKTIIEDKRYLKNMLSPSQKLNPAYGYLWWLNGQPVRRGGRAQRELKTMIKSAPEDLVAAQGALGRKVYVVPSMKLVVVRLGEAPEPSFNEVFWKKLMAATPPKGE